jgi:transposase-like protein
MPVVIRDIYKSKDPGLEEIIGDLKKAIDAAGEDAYLISEHLREGCTSCPFCYERDLNFGMVDETHTGILRQQITCLDCGESWTVEYEASRVSYEGKWYSRYEYWPTYIQAKSIKYKERLMAKYGIKYRPDVENVKEGKSGIPPRTGPDDGGE